MEAYLEAGWGGGVGMGRYVPTMFLLRIPSACESVYREIFVRRRESLPSKSWVSQQNRETWEVCNRAPLSSAISMIPTF